MIVRPSTPRHSEIANSIVSLQLEFPEIPEEDLDQQFIRALRTEETIPAALAKCRYYAAEIKKAKAHRVPFGPSLQSTPLSNVVPYEMAKYCDSETFNALVTVCKDFAGVLRRNGQNCCHHVTKGKTNMAFVNPQIVKSLEIGGIYKEPAGKPELSAITLCEKFPNCRTVWWKLPSDWRTKYPQGTYIESNCFSLQSIDGLYFRFYPRGKERSRKGFCSLYIGSGGSVHDVELRLSLRSHSHTITQKLNDEYVDGFVNFCDLSGHKGDISIGIHVLHGPQDSHEKDMKVEASRRVATWTIPRMCSSRLKDIQIGDRITSDVFSLRGLGDDACLVLYPKGDTVDAISRVGDFVNAGLFGSSNRDVTFRMSAGKVSKVLTAFAERFQTKATGVTKSCGEFFDACYGLLPDLIDSSTDQLKLRLEILDNEGSQSMKTNCKVKGKLGSVAQWRFNNISSLLGQMNPGEALYSRYFTLMDIPGVFFGFSIVFLKDEIQVSFTQVNQKAEETIAKFDLNFRYNDQVAGKSCTHTFNGIHDTYTTTFEKKHSDTVSSFAVEVDLWRWRQRGQAEI